MNLFLINKNKLESTDFNTSITHYPEDYISDITKHTEWIDELSETHHIPIPEILDKLNCGEFMIDCEGDIVSSDYQESLKYVDSYINEELDVFGNYEPPFISAVWDWRE